MYNFILYCVSLCIMFYNNVCNTTMYLNNKRNTCYAYTRYTIIFLFEKIELISSKTTQSNTALQLKLVFSVSF